MALSAYERALRLLGQRQHFRGDLRRKLLARGYEAVEVDAALARCAAEGYLDDEAAVRAFVDERQRRRGLGRARIAAELRRRGAPAADVASALADVGDEEELARARDAAARWRRTHCEEGEAARAKLARHLQRRGFAAVAVRSVLKSRTGAAAGEELEPEPID